MHKIQKKVIKELQARLYDRREYLAEAIQRRSQDCNDSGGYRLPDVIDVASLASTEQLAALVAKVELRELKEIEDALARINSGSYGVCKVCGGTIRKDRLEVLPYATLCVKCKELEEEGYGLEGLSDEQDYGEVVDADILDVDSEGADKKKRGKAKKVKARKYSHN